eukprot:m.240533 g.240533  ORF g.240533 m.240533 type:complete len:504 (-) comp18988_c0_seq8:922-2433(-)
MLLLIVFFFFLTNWRCRIVQGLRVLDKYSLHLELARQLDRPLVEPEWRATVIDCLLNFAGTPRGVALLHATGAALMRECVDFMLDRYVKKLQVSKYEKFGYGVLLCELSATVPGAQALHDAGFSTLFMQDFWLSAVAEVDYPVPATLVNDPQHATRRAVAYVCSAMSSQASVQVLLRCASCRPDTAGPTSAMEQVLNSGTPPPKPTEPHSSAFRLSAIVDLLRPPEDQQFLCNYESAYIMALQVVHVLCTNLAVFLALDSTYNLVDLVFALQRRNQLTLGVETPGNEGGSNNGGEEQRQPDDPIIVIDQSALYRNRFLVAMSVLGGSRERRLPSVEAGEALATPLFCSRPLPKAYICRLAHGDDGEAAAAQASDSAVPTVVTVSDRLAQRERCAALIVSSLGSAKQQPKLNLQDNASGSVHAVGLDLLCSYAVNIGFSEFGEEATRARLTAFLRNSWLLDDEVCCWCLSCTNAAQLNYILTPPTVLFQPTHGLNCNKPQRPCD